MILTRPGQQTTSPTALVDAAQSAAQFQPRPVSAETANALVTESPLSSEELAILREHYRALNDLLAMSGPRFSSARRDAAEMHNRATRRLVGIRDEAKRRAAEIEDGALLEIAG